MPLVAALGLLFFVLAGCATPTTPATPELPIASLGPSLVATAPSGAGSASPVSTKPDIGVGGGAQAFVVDVVDGDTITVRVGGKERTIRLIGIDTPETVDPFQEVGCYGPQASAFVHRELDGAHVRLTYDIERLDRYGRTLAYVWTDDMFNERLVREGYATAFPYPPNTRYAARFARAQQQARAQELGLWKSCATGSTGAADDHTGSNGSERGRDCEPAYPSVCLARGSDLDCAQVSATDFKAKPEDPFFLDGNHDGRACESS